MRTISLYMVIILIITGLCFGKAIVVDIAKPCGLTWDGEHFWTTDRQEGLVCQLDETGKVITSFSVGPMPMGVAWDNGRLWVVDREDGTLSLVEPGGKVIKALSLPVDRPAGLSLGQDGLWLADERARKLVKVSTTDGSILDEMPAPYGLNGLCVATDGDFYLSSRLYDRIYRGSVAHKLCYYYFPSPGTYAWGLAGKGEEIWHIDQAERTLQPLELPKKWVQGEKKERVVHLRNGLYNYGPGEVTDVKLYVALPENKYNQEIKAIRHSRAADEQLVDDNGQAFACFYFDRVKPGQRIRVITDVAFSHWSVQAAITPEDVGGEIPKHIRELYVRDGEKYDLDFAGYDAMLARADQEENLYLKAFRIYRYVADQVEYELYGGWEPASVVLSRGSGSCSEYSFSTLALLRKAGIPARYVGAVSLRGDDICYDNVSHRWIEVYLPGFGWFPVDANAGDSDDVARQAFSFGGTAQGYLITTKHYGPSRYLEWSYNSHMTFARQGKAKVYEESLAEWDLPEGVEPERRDP